MGRGTANLSSLTFHTSRSDFAKRFVRPEVMFDPLMPNPNCFYDLLFPAPFILLIFYARPSLSLTSFPLSFLSTFCLINWNHMYFLRWKSPLKMEAASIVRSLFLSLSFSFYVSFSFSISLSLVFVWASCPFQNWQIKVPHYL